MQLPAGTVTFLFTDIEGSTRLLRELGDSAYAALLGQHHRLVREALAKQGGVEVQTDGDAFFAAFGDAVSAVCAARDLQLALRRHTWPPGAEMKVRMGLHSGEAQPVEGEYVALAVNQAARVASAAHGGQVLLSERTRMLVGDSLSPTTIAELGRFRLKDFPEAEALFQLVGPELERDFPAIRAVPAAANNFPHPRTSFVGRDDALAALGPAINDAPLVTLTGPGGSGKTRLAQEFAIRIVSHFADGACLVELAPLREGSLVVSAVARAIGVRERPDQALLATVCDHLAGKRMLVVLDNCEHLLDACAHLVDAVIESCPDTRILATSREQIGVGGELLWPVPPLEVPATQVSLEQAWSSDAVRLFVQRAEAVRPGMRPGDRQRAAIVQICRRLDGLPLAIELAAARSAALTPIQIADRLDRRFSLLKGGGRTAAARQKTLRAAIEWSYDLLTAMEQAAMRRMSVFSGDFELSAAEAVVHGDTIDVNEVPGLLVGLVDKSLVVARDDDRFTLLETIREYGRLRLDEAGEMGEARDRHFSWVAAISQRGPEDDDEVAWHDRLDREFAELRAAIDWSLAGGNADLALAVCASTGTFLADRWHLSEGRAWLETLLERSGNAQLTTRAICMDTLACIAFYQGDTEATGQIARAGLPLAREAGNAELECRLLTKMLLGLDENDVEAQRDVCRMVLEVARANDVQRFIVVSHINLGALALMAGDSNDARVEFGTALEIAQVTGSRRPLAYAFGGLAAAAVDCGRPADAYAPLLEALRLQFECDNRFELAVLMDTTAGLALGAGHPRPAATLLGARERVLRESGIGNPHAYYLARSERHTSAAREALRPDEFEDAWNAGAMLDLGQAVELAARTVNEAAASAMSHLPALGNEE